MENDSLFKSMDLITALGGDVDGPDSRSKQYSVKLNGKTYLLGKNELIAFAKSLARDFLNH